MNSNFALRLAGVCGAGLALSLTASAQVAAETPRAALAPTATPHAAATATNPEAAAAASADASPALTRAEALEKIALAKRYVAHPPKTAEAGPTEQLVHMPEFDIAIPPPAPRPETKPPAPAAGQVWVAGHYMPVKGEWRWVRGEWAVPATPSSVWIAARYDEKEQRWAPGYWQPDVPTPADQAPGAGAAGVYAPASSATKDTPVTPTPSRY